MRPGFGVGRVGTTDAVNADTVFQLASVSKSIGATVVAHQVASGVVAWNTPIVKHLPWFALGDDWVTRHVTIADMYAHRSGLPDHAGDEAWKTLAMMWSRSCAGCAMRSCTRFATSTPTPISG